MEQYFAIQGRKSGYSMKVVKLATRVYSTLFVVCPLFRTYITYYFFHQMHKNSSFWCLQSIFEKITRVLNMLYVYTPSQNFNTIKISVPRDIAT